MRLAFVCLVVLAAMLQLCHPAPTSETDDRVQMTSCTGEMGQKKTNVKARSCVHNGGFVPHSRILFDSATM